MRTKRSARGRFHRSSHRSDSATAARPLPPPLTDNVSNENNSCEDRMEVQNSTGTDDSVSDFSGVAITTDVCEKTCLECGRGEQLLFCCGISCPVALHEKCLLNQPRYDEGGKFFCPYCWYKLQEARTEELRKKVMLAKEDVNSFINFRSQMICGDKEKQNNKRVKRKDLNVGKNTGETNQCEHVTGMDVDEVQKLAQEVEEDHQYKNNVNLPCINRNGEEAECEKLLVNEAHGVVEDELGREQGMNERQNDDEKDEDADEERAEACVAEKTVVDCSAHGFLIAKSGTSNRPERDHVRMMKKKEEKMNKDAPTTNVSCTTDHEALDGPEVPVSETEDYVGQLRHVKRRNIQKEDPPKSSTVHSHNSSARATRIPVEEVTPLKKPKPAEMPAKKFIDLPCAREEIKRMLWKPEKEDTLKNGVQQLEGDHQPNSKVKCPCTDQNGEVPECEKISATHARRVVEDEADEEHAVTLTAQCVVEEIAVDGAFHRSLGGKSEIANKSERNRTTLEREEQMNKDTSSASVSYAMKDIALNGPEVCDSETGRLVKRRNNQKAESKKKSEAHSCITSTKASRKPAEEVAPLKKPLLPEIPAKKIYPPVAHETRKRTLWKPEEEEALRKGVQKFSTTANKNLPWRKILEFGRHVFDPSRNPTDLKDKWRNILAKLS